jgi:hypothetical protein
MTQRGFEKLILQILASILLSVIAWTVINNLIVPVSFLRYILIEVLLLFTFRFYIFVATAIQRIAE